MRAEASYGTGSLLAKGKSAEWISRTLEVTTNRLVASDQIVVCKIV